MCFWFKTSTFSFSVARPFQSLSNAKITVILSMHLQIGIMNDLVEWHTMTWHLQHWHIKKWTHASFHHGFLQFLHGHQSSDVTCICPTTSSCLIWVSLCWSLQNGSLVGSCHMHGQQQDSTCASKALLLQTHNQFLKLFSDAIVPA